MIKYTVTREDNEQNKNLDRSKIFGSPVFPKDFMSKKGLMMIISLRRSI